MTGSSPAVGPHARRIGIAALAALGACGGPAAPRRPAGAALPEPGLELAIYTAGDTEAEARADGFAMVVDRRRMQLPGGVADVAFDGVPDTIDPGSVWFRSFTDPRGTLVLEQSYDYDGADLGQLLRDQIGEQVVLVREDGELTGVLARVDPSSCVLDVGGGQQVTVPVDRALLGARLSSGRNLSVRPTLQWKLQVARPGEHLVEVAYAARRVSWWTTYTAVVDARDPAATAVELSAWATVANDSSLRFSDARVALVAGERGAAPGPPAATAASEHTWRIEQPVTLDPRTSRQLRLFATRERVPGRIELRYEGMPAALLSGAPTDQYYGATYQPRVDTVLVIESDEPLPPGAVDVLARRAGDEEPTLVARSQLAAAREHGEANVALGPASAITGSRRQVAFNYDPATHQINEALAIELQNQRAEPVRVIVREQLYRAAGGAEVVNASPEPRSSDGKRVTFALDVPAHGSAVASYEAIYKGVTDTVNR